MKQCEIINVYAFLLANKPDISDVKVSMNDYRAWEAAYYPVHQYVQTLVNVVEIKE